jgi:hypothetical protein
MMLILWHLKWQRYFFTWEEELYRNLLLPFQVVPLTIEKQSQIYSPDSGGFSVKVNYSYLSSKLPSTTFLSLRQCKVLQRVWCTWAPSKVIVFLWQALLSRIPTKLNLAARGVILVGGYAMYAFCGGGLKSKDHLFILCPFDRSI